MVRAVALPTAMASSRIARIRSSGANGCPLRIPTAASCPRISGSAAPAGSCWTSSSIVVQNEKSFGVIVLISRCTASTNVVSGIAGAPASGARPARKLPTAVPIAPGVYEYIRKPALMASTAGPGSLSIMNARPITVARVVRTWETWKPLSGSGSS